MATTVFIDGDSGTTGLEIFRRLRERPELRILKLPPERRKDLAARTEALNACDLAILCLPDDAAIEAVGLVQNPSTRILDASSAFRTHPDWVYGFAELCEGQPQRIAEARRVANVGCFAVGAIAILRPLIDSGLMAPTFPVTLNAVSGYTGGGKSLIEAFEAPGSAGHLTTAFYEYGLGFAHKHLPEIMQVSGLSSQPILIPSVARYPRGMLVNLPLHLDALGSAATGRDVQAVFEKHYPPLAGSQVRVRPPGEGTANMERLEAEALAGTDWLDIQIYHHPAKRQALVVAILDNLGKGACGAAIQNIGLMTGLTGLDA